MSDRNSSNTDSMLRQIVQPDNFRLLLAIVLVTQQSPLFGNSRFNSYSVDGVPPRVALDSHGETRGKYTRSPGIVARMWDM